MNRIPFTELHRALSQALVKLCFESSKADACARLFTETTCDGVYSHGVNRFPRFVAMVRSGTVDVKGEAERIGYFGALERWDGNRGVGNLNAQACMSRTIELARLHGIGCVSLRNTNHWMRGGSYGWQAVGAGLIGVCWTNTMPNLPPWGGIDASIGNNPLAIGVPRRNSHVVLDIAMSQFSYGALASHRSRGQLLSVDGGFDTEGHLTRDPAAIEESQRPLPIGYWKGSGLAVMLDLIAATVSLGRATCEIAPDPLKETAISQMFIAIHPAALGSQDQLEQIADEVVSSLHQCRPVNEGRPVRYPGEQTLLIRAENLKLGIPVDSEIWEQILAI